MSMSALTMSETWLCCLPTVWPWGNYLASLSLTVPTGEVWIGNVKHTPHRSALKVKLT